MKFSQNHHFDEGRQKTMTIIMTMMLMMMIDNGHLEVGRQKTLEHLETLVHPLKHTHLVRGSSKIMLKIVMF